MAKFCTNCGKPLRGNEKFCTECGKNLQPNNCHSDKILPNDTLSNETNGVLSKNHENQGQSDGKYVDACQKKISDWILMILIFVVVIIFSLILKECVFQQNSSNISFASDADTETLIEEECIEEVEEPVDVPAEAPDVAHHGAVLYKDNYNLVFQGAMMDNCGTFPIKVSFTLKDGNIIKDCVYQNIQYGGKIKMKGTLTNDCLELFGKDGKNDFTIKLDVFDSVLIQGATYYGESVDGSKRLSVRLTLAEYDKIN